MAELAAAPLVRRDPVGRFVEGHHLGRPSLFSPELAERIAAAVMEHGSVVAACKADETLPAADTIYGWLGSSEHFASVPMEERDRFRRMIQVAREAKADSLYDEWEQETRACLAAPDKDRAAAVREFGVMTARKAAALWPDRYATRRQGEAACANTDVSVAVQVVLPPKDQS